MEFDQETLEPTYRLLQGIPGSSNALAIAKKLGLPRAVLSEARGYLSRGHAEVERVISSLVGQQQRLDQESREASREREQAAALRRELEGEQQELQAKREKILREARDEARTLLRRAKSASDSMIRELRRVKAGSGGREALSRAEGARRELQALRREVENEPGLVEAPALPAAELAAGRVVFVQSLQKKGEIIALEGDQALVQVGAIRVQLPQRELRRWEGSPAPVEPQRGSSYTVQKETVIHPEVNLHGKTVEEAIPLVDKLLDDALWAGLGQVTVNHGKGTGRLKEGLRAYLREHPLVKSLRGGAAGEGGGGVTIVVLIGGTGAAP